MTKSKKRPLDELAVRIRFRMVGQGDTIILESMSGEVRNIGIIDCRNDRNGDNAAVSYLRYLDHCSRPYNVKFILFTHPHRDHCQGAVQLLRYLAKKEKILGHYGHTFHFDRRYRHQGKVLRSLIGRIYAAIKKMKAEYKKAGGTPPGGVFLNLSSSLDLDRNIRIRCFCPQDEEIDQYRLARNPPSSIANLLSTVLSVEYRNSYVLLTSDTEFESFDRVLTEMKKTLPGMEMLAAQVPHHGSEKNFDVSFWARIDRDPGRPCPAIISVGENSYGHPSKKVTDQLRGLSYEPEETSDKKRFTKKELKAKRQLDDDSKPIDRGRFDTTIEVPK